MKTQWVPSMDLLLQRSVVTLIECPLFFWSCLAWEGFALLSTDLLGESKFSASYCFMAGLGSFLGALAYSTLLVFIQSQLTETSIWSLLPESVARSIAGGVTTGTLWQFSVNISELKSYSFTGAFFFVYFMSVIAFFTMMFLIRFSNTLFLSSSTKFNIKPYSLDLAYYDLMLALCTGAADAFFIGTDNSQFADGWLSSFNVSDSMNAAQKVALAGAAGLTGFLVYQTLVNLIVPLHWAWVDGLPLFDEDNVSHDGGDLEEEDFTDDRNPHDEGGVPYQET